MLCTARVLLAVALLALPLSSANAMSFTLDTQFAPTESELNDPNVEVPNEDEVSAQALNSFGELTGPEDGIQNWGLTSSTYLFNDSANPLLLSDDDGTSLAKITSWTVTLKRDPFVTNNINVTNTAAFTQIFIATVTLPIPAYAYTRVVNSSVGVTATDSDGQNDMLVDVVGSNAFYRGRIDGVTALSLTPPDIPITTANCGFAGCSHASSAGVASFNVPDGVATEIEIILQFSLSPGDSVGVTSRFEIIPEPTTAALFGLGLTGLAAVGRRRKA